MKNIKIRKDLNGGYNLNGGNMNYNDISPEKIEEILKSLKPDKEFILYDFSGKGMEEFNKAVKEYYNNLFKMEKQFRLPKEFADKWIAALRSGEYEQGSEHLMHIIPGKKENYEDILGLDDCNLKKVCNFCCLGVAGYITNIPVDDLFQEPIFDRAKFKEYIPEEIYGQTDHNKFVKVLTILNDGVTNWNYDYNKIDKNGYNFRIDLKQALSENSMIVFTFNEIADFIEDNCEFYEEETIKQ